jgi:hypothetical protein
VSCSASRSPSPTDTVGESAQADRRRVWVTATSPCWRTCASTPARRAKDDEERAAFAGQLAALADAYVSDGFGVVHRKQASVYDIATLLPSAMGGLVAAEVEVLKRLTEDPERPYAVVLGGAKVADKLAVIDNLMNTADRCSSAAACSSPSSPPGPRSGFQPARQADNIETCKEYLPAPRSPASRSSCRSTSSPRPSSRPTPSTTWCRPTASPPTRWASTSAQARRSCTPSNAPTRRRSSGTARWARSRWRPFAAGTEAVAKALVEATADGVLTVVGGGDSAAAVRQLGFADDQFGHISTGGGASLEYLEGKELPGIAILKGTDTEGAAMSRTPLIAGNWKMNLNHLAGHAPGAEARLDARDGKHDFGAVEVAVLPPFTDLRSVQTLIEGDKLPLQFGAQDLSVHDSGAYTGEISAAFLAKLGCTYVVVGHSERRDYHAETDAVVNEKVKAAYAARHHPDRLLRRGPGRPQGRRARSPTCSRRSTRCSKASPPSRPADRHRLRAHLGDRHRRGGDPRGRSGGLRGDPHPARRALPATWRPASSSLRRFGEVQQRGGHHGQGGRRRRPRRRRLARRRAEFAAICRFKDHVTG